jgi:endonuclease-8
MPEGDTLHRTAAVLDRALRGEAIVRVEVGDARFAELARRLDARSVVHVEARGKNLLVHLDDDSAIWSHLRMTGSWHVYLPGEPWQRPTRQRTIGLTTRRSVAVGFNVPVLEWLDAARLARHPVLCALGPDLLAPTFDVALAVARMRSVPLVALGEALVDQRLVAGIGNVYKSELLFVLRLDPFAPVAAYDDTSLCALLERARVELQRNVDGRPRRTRRDGAAQRHFVYGRRGEPCARCGHAIAVRSQGAAGRSTYWCATCQPAKRHA